RTSSDKARRRRASWARKQPGSLGFRALLPPHRELPPDRARPDETQARRARPQETSGRARPPRARRELSPAERPCRRSRRTRSRARPRRRAKRAASAGGEAGERRACARCYTRTGRFRQGYASGSAGGEELAHVDAPRLRLGEAGLQATPHDGVRIEGEELGGGAWRGVAIPERSEQQRSLGHRGEEHRAGRRVALEPPTLRVAGLHRSAPGDLGFDPAVRAPERMRRELAQERARDEVLVQPRVPARVE